MNLKQLRKSRNLLQSDVAEYLGVERTTYVKYENNSIPPNVDILKKLSEFYDVSIDFLLGLKERTTNNIIDLKETSLIKKIKKLNQIDKIKTEAYVDGLLANDAYFNISEIKIIAEDSYNTGTVNIDDEPEHN